MKASQESDCVKTLRKPDSETPHFGEAFCFLDLNQPRNGLSPNGLEHAGSAQDIAYPFEVIRQRRQTQF